MHGSNIQGIVNMIKMILKNLMMIYLHLEKKEINHATIKSFLDKRTRLFFIVYKI